MKPIFSVGPFSIYFFGMMIAIGALIGFLLFLKEIKRRGLDKELLTDGIIYSLIGGIIGARIIYVLIYNPSYYLTNPIEVLFIHKGGLSIHGGILGGLVTGYWYMKRHKLPTWQILDIVAPSLILAQGISRIGCDVFGAPVSSSLPWAIKIDGELLHPAQAYEFLLDYLLFGYLWLRLKRKEYHGQVFLHYLISFLLIRGIVEFTRINPMVFGPFSVSHVLSLFGIGIGLILIRYQKTHSPALKPTPLQNRNYISTSLFVLIMMFLSVIIYYWVQG